ncbi:hypothetical protein MHU86_16882 [Fragilaria crotonensis]|nr:hypothetical protein MHU86_16882 [Fragilaria crotonensis]
MSRGESPQPVGGSSRIERVSAAELVRSLLGVSAPSTARRPSANGLYPGKPGSGKHPGVCPSRGDERNAKRLKEANESDRETIGESPSDVRQRRESHLPGDASLFFPTPVVGPCDDFEPPDWFLAAIKKICADPSIAPTKPPVRFELSEEASEHNASVLRALDFDLGRLIRDNSSSTLGFGSEFRPVGQLRTLIEGTPLPSTCEPPKRRDALRICQGLKLRRKERRGGSHACPGKPQVSAAGTGARAMVQPLGLVQQWSIDHDGERKIKYRLTQDLSFSTNRTREPTSINARVNMSAYVEMVYGWCFPRIVHFIVSLRSQNPTLLILISKYDYSDAYRRIAHSAEAATQTIAINGETAFLSLRLTFGGSPNPPTWCMFSELVTDLANEIGQCDDWNPDEVRAQHSHGRRNPDAYRQTSPSYKPGEWQ